MAAQPEQIGRYEIQSLIGQGGMGKVYRARDPWMDRLVAIKTIEIGGRPEDRNEMRKRVLREIRACGRLMHPNIVQVFDVGQQEELAYLVMELVDGGELLGKKPPDEAVNILSQVAEALDFAHEQGIIHRDIKPGNILIDSKGKAKVLDFGIARVLDEQSLTKTGMTAGTPHYMPPEQLRAEKIGPAADQYALAVTAYELLTGEKPFIGDSLASLMYSVVNNRPRPIPDFPPAVEMALKKGLSKLPGRRYGSCLELVKELHRGLNSSPTPANSKSADHFMAAVPSPTSTAESIVSVEPERSIDEGFEARELTRVVGAGIGRRMMAVLALIAATSLLAFAVAARWYFQGAPRERAASVNSLAMSKAELNPKEKEELPATPFQGDSARSPGDPSSARINGIAMEFVWIPPGEFEMGCSPGDRECTDREEPRHQVQISRGFEMGKFEVTQAQWSAAMGANPGYFNSSAIPATNVSWDDTQEFLSVLNGLRDRYRYRLPTEAEWEYAARAGSEIARYGQLLKIGWYKQEEDFRRTAQPVGRKIANAWGLHDMLGNAWEWCQDWQGYYTGISLAAPSPAPSGDRARRGGSFDSYAWNLRASYRVGSRPSVRRPDYGFRCVREAN